MKPGICDECGSKLPPDAPEGFCPSCLLGLAEIDSKEETSAVEGKDDIGNYEIIELIGEGGMGIVYKALQVDLGRIVALKMIRSGPFATGPEIKRFRTEAQAAAGLQHPNMVAIHEVGEHLGRQFFSMEFIEGQSLAEVVRSSPLPAERAARYVREVAEAVHHAHESGILHRDIKPANVLVDGKDTPRIMDFGLAKQIHLDSGLTASGDFMGTPSYSAPEQAEGRTEEIGPGSDVYSLGAMLYDLMTGRPPFKAETPLDTLRQVVDEEPVSPRLLNPQVPKDAETIILKCLSKDPVDRYSSAHDLADELGRFLRHEPIEARPVPRIGRLLRWAKRKPTRAGLSLVALLLFLLLGVAALMFRQEVLNGNMKEADLTARVIAAELNELGEEVAEIAEQDELRSLLEKSGPGSTDTADLESFLRKKFESTNVNGPRWMGAEPFNSVNLFSQDGVLLARWPAAERGGKDSFADRDYLRGALAGKGQPYVSQIYRSRTDESEDKFGVGVRIQMDSGGPDYIFMASVATAPTGSLSGFQRDAVLIGKKDASDRTRENEWLIVAHPAFDESSVAIEMEGLPMAEVPGRSGFYRDPAAGRHKRYAGYWLAGSARIEGTDFVVIVQGRDWVSVALIATVLGGGFVAIVFLLIYFRRTGKSGAGSRQ